MRIGIPKGLHYTFFAPFWEHFFRELGYEVICSPSTNRQIINKGIAESIDDACFPIKVCHGHVADLCKKADAIFLPRLKSFSCREYNCPMICGLPEMVKGTIRQLPALFCEEIDANSGEKGEKEWLDCLAHFLNREAKTLKTLYGSLRKEHGFMNPWYSDELMQDYILPDRSKIGGRPLRVAVVGQPYNLTDPYLNQNLFEKMRKRGISILTQYDLTGEEIVSKVKGLPKRVFWTTGKQIVAGSLFFLEGNIVDGLIYLSSCGCGLDSLLEGYISLHAKKSRKVAYSLLTVDEHTGEAGFNTRIEAFLDMVEWRKQHENNVSTYGRSVYNN